MTSDVDLLKRISGVKGQYGGHCFGGTQPLGITYRNQMPCGLSFPNGAKGALLLTFDVEGNYGNGTGDTQEEVANYRRICDRLRENGIQATFNVVGKMIEGYGHEFVEQMFAADCEVATHGYVHDLNKRHGGEHPYASQYGFKENLEQIRDGIEVIHRIRPNTVRGVRIPYGIFNEYVYDAIEELGLAWSSIAGGGGFPGSGPGLSNMPFQMQLGEKLYPSVEIPMDSQTFDWAIFIADEKSNPAFVESVRAYCLARDIPFNRSPGGAAEIWEKRMLDTLEQESCFTFICHPINLTIKDARWKDAVDEFLLRVIDKLGVLHREKKAWVCTCNQMAEFYRENVLETRVGQGS